MTLKGGTFANPDYFVLTLNAGALAELRLQGFTEAETARAERDAALVERDKAQKEARLFRLNRNAWRIAALLNLALFWLVIGLRLAS